MFDWVHGYEDGWGAIMDVVNVVERISDELVAILIVIAGLIYLFTSDFQNGYTLVSAGTGYLFGKSVPKK